MFMFLHLAPFTMEYYSAIKKSRIMPVVAMWMDLKIIILSEVSQRILCLNNHMVISHQITRSRSCRARVNCDSPF